MAPKRFLDEARTEEPQSKKHKSFSKEKTDIVTNLESSNNAFCGEEINENKTLNEAAKNGLIEIVKHFLLQGVNVNQKNEDGKSPLHLASEKGHVKVVTELLNSGAEVDLETDRKPLPYWKIDKDDGGKSALHFASENGHAEIVAMLLANGASVNRIADPRFEPIEDFFEGNRPIHIATIKGHLEVTSMLISKH